MFHDIFGHIPLLANPEYSTFMQEFGKLGKRFVNNPEILVELQRLYWFTIEFGLKAENGELRILGAGIISSFHESNSSIQDENVQRKAFNLDEICHTDFSTSEIQNRYFILENLEQLKNTIPQLELKYSTHEMDINR